MYIQCMYTQCMCTYMICLDDMYSMDDYIPLNSENHRYSLTYLRSDISLFKNSHIMYFIIVQVLFRALMGSTIPCFWIQSIHIINPTIIYSFFSETIDTYLSMWHEYTCFFLCPTADCVIDIYFSLSKRFGSYSHQKFLC